MMVMAIALAPSRTPASPVGDAAKSVNLSVWIPTPRGATAIMGWIDGTTWLTLPISVEPTTLISPSGSVTTLPIAALFVA